MVSYTAVLHLELSGHPRELQIFFLPKIFYVFDQFLGNSTHSTVLAQKESRIYLGGEGYLDIELNFVLKLQRKKFKTCGVNCINWKLNWAILTCTQLKIIFW